MEVRRHHLVAWAILAACRAAEPAPVPPSPVSPSPAVVASIRAACGSCHVAPAPETAAKRVWQRVMPKMYRQAAQLRPDLPAYDDVLRYFVERAPEELEVATAGELSPRALVQAHEVALADDARQPEVTCLRHLGADRIAHCDTDRRGIAIRALGSNAELAFVPGAGIPVFVDTADVDRDGRDDLLVADLGAAPPVQTTKGRILWIRAAGADRWEAPRELVTGLGRVVGAALRDLDGDGRRELVVAEFGAETNGGLYVYELDDRARTRPGRRTLDARSGAVRIAIADLDGDGHDDVVAAFAQQHEQVIVYRNTGRGSFAARTLFAAPTPGWGMVGLAVVDFDRDGDLDVLSINGDTLDTHELRPFHGVYLHRQHAGAFTTERVGALPGACGLAVGDLDGDGDLDAAATAFAHPEAAARVPAPLPSAAWFEQTEHGFVTHSLATGPLDAISIAGGDLDSDGDLDLVIGRRTWTPTSVWAGGGDRTAMVWFENRGTGATPSERDRQ